MREVSQQQLNEIDRYLSKTSEPFDDWEWDGEILIIFKDCKPIEFYSFLDLCQMIPNFKQL